MARFGFMVAAIAILLGTVAARAQSGEPVGVWLTEKGGARVRVTKCGSGICGVIVRLKDPILTEPPSPGGIELPVLHEPESLEMPSS